MGAFSGGLKGALKHIDTVVVAIRKTGFRFTRSKEIDVALEYLQKLLHLDESATILFCFFFYMYYDNNERAITLSQISNFSGCSPMVPLQFVSEYNTLKDLGLLEVVSLPPSEGVSAGEFFKIPSDVERFICSDGKESRLGALSRDKNSKLVFPDKIRERELFYSAQVAEQVDKLTSSLQEENLLGIQKRLAEHKMPVGISAILYGESGTGKTETVYQIARKSGRPVFHVNIGDILSEWHNATEKKLGELFMQYQKMVEQCRSRKEPMPICLFNEADVISGRRLNPPRQAVEIAENRNQNILLEQMERMEGILIATTNMEGTLDDAFSRRFLFTIKLEKPELQVQTKVWRDKLKWLSEESAHKLAHSYQLSGGEIDNIAKKAIMEEILRGKPATIGDLEEYCKVEKLGKSGSTRPVGFGG